MHAFNRVLLASAASLVSAAAAQAQTQSLGSPVTATGSYAGEDSLDRAAVYTQSAFTAPKGHYGFTVQAGRASATSEFAGVKSELNATGAAFSAFYGITDGITVGAGLPYSSLSSPGSESVDGLGDMELFGRMRAFRSASGSTRMAVAAGVTLPTGDDLFTADDPTYEVGAQMTHRMDRISLHVAPALRMVKDVDMSYDLNIAATYAASPKLALSLEGLNSFEGGTSGFDADRTRLTDIGAGVRYTGIENMVLDLGLRKHVNNSIEGADISATGVNFGFSWLF